MTDKKLTLHLDFHSGLADLHPDRKSDTKPVGKRDTQTWRPVANSPRAGSGIESQLQHRGACLSYIG